MDFKIENKGKQMSGIAQYWLVWFAFIIALIYICKSRQPLWLLILAVVCVPVGNPVKMAIKIMEVKNKNE